MPLLPAGPAVDFLGPEGVGVLVRRVHRVQRGKGSVSAAAYVKPWASAMLGAYPNALSVNSQGHRIFENQTALHELH
jgi:hypothetical protein